MHIIGRWGSKAPSSANTTLSLLPLGRVGSYTQCQMTGRVEPQRDLEDLLVKLMDKVYYQALPGGSSFLQMERS